MSFFKIAKACLVFSTLLVIASLVLLFVPGPRYSIEFTGGTMMEVQLPEGKTKEELEAQVQTFKPTGEPLENTSVLAVHGEKGDSFIIRMRPLSNEEHVSLLGHLETAFGKEQVKELQFNTIGPSVSASLAKRSIIALIVASAAVVIYLAFSFRNIPRKLNPWKFGMLAVAAFMHDVIITAGIFVIISHFTTFEVDTLFVTALLTILAYSANDTIVIYDRIRANLTYENRSEDFNTSVVRGLKECLTRTLHTTMSSLIMLFSIFFLGADSIQWFILALIIGTFIGTYSSYLVAAPLLVFWK